MSEVFGLFCCRFIVRHTRVELIYHGSLSCIVNFDSTYKIKLEQVRTKAFIFITGKEKTITNIQFFGKISLYFPFCKVMLKFYKDCKEVNTY